MSDKFFIQATLSEKFAAALKQDSEGKNLWALTIKLIAGCKNANVLFNAEKATALVENFTTRQEAEEVLQKLQELKSIKSAYISTVPTFF